MAAPEWAPSADDVAAHIPQRFRDGTPTADTVPTVTQVDRLIELRATEVAARCGEPLDEGQVYSLAAETTALGVCAYLESSFFPEQQLGSDDQTAVFFRMRYEEHIRLLRGHIRYWRRGTGRLTGTVSDSGGQPIEGAEVTATADDGSSRTATSDADGTYQLRLDPDDYTVTATADGFQGAEKTAAIITQTTTTVDFTLETQ